MADNDNIYSSAYENLGQYEEELRECFQRRADKKGQINSEDIVDLIDDISVIFAFDCDRSKFFFSQENRSIPKGYNLNALKFNEFMDLFGLWLLKESEAFGQDSDRPRSGDDSQIGQRFSTYGNDQVTEQYEPNEQNEPSPNYEKNRKLMDELIKKHKQNYKAIFNERLFEEGQIQVYMQDFFIVLQEWFDLEAVDLKEKADDDVDFFMSVGSYKRLLGIAEGFFLEEKGADPNELDVREAQISFEECLAFLDYWFRNDRDVILVDKRGGGDTKGEGGVKKVLEDTIAKYEQMIKDTNNPVEKEILTGTVETLKKKLSELEKGDFKGEKGARNSENDQQKREERKNKALKEIFDFYCTQQLNVGRSATFAKLDRLSTTITLGTFKVLLKTFKLKLDHFKLIELYNKSANQDDNLTFDEFKDLIYKVALRAEFAPEEKVHQPNPEIMKDYKPTSYKDDPRYKQFKQNEARRKEEAQNNKKKRRPYQDKTKRDDERIEEIWEHMGLYDGRYRAIMGFFNLPFGSQDKQDFRIAAGSIKYRYRDPTLEGKSPQEIQEEINKRNELRKLVKNLKSMEQGVLTNFRGSSSPAKPVNKDGDETYVQKRTTKLKNAPTNIPKKLTMKKVENLQQKEIKDDRFNPYDLIDDNDDDDNMYLAEYNIGDEKHRIRTQQEVDRKKAEEYGKLKKATKGKAVNGKYGSGVQSTDVSRNYHNDANPYSPQGYGMGYGSPQQKPYAHPQQPPQANLAYYDSPRNAYSGRPRIPLGNQPSYLEYEAMGYGRSPTNNSGHGSPVSNNGNGYISGFSGYNGYGGYGGYNGVNEGYGRNNGYGNNGNRSPAYGSAIDRVSQIEMDSRRKEQQMMSNVMNIQSNQLKKGLKVAGK